MPGKSAACVGCISITATSSVSCQKAEKQNYARLHYLLKDDLMKMEAITQETRLLCRNHIDTAEQLCSYKGSLETEMSALLQKRKELYSKSRRISGEEKEAVKAEISDISGRLKVIRKEVRLCEGISARSDTLKEKLQTIRADENEQRRKELMKNEHRRRSGRTNRPNELGRGFEVAAKITGAGAKNIAILLYSILKEEKKTKGKARLTSMLRSGKELKVFTVKSGDLKKFTQGSKKNTVCFTASSRTEKTKTQMQRSMSSLVPRTHRKSAVLWNALILLRWIPLLL